MVPTTLTLYPLLQSRTGNIKTVRYIEYLKASEKRSNELGIGSRLALNYPVAARDIDQYIDISNRELLGLLIQRFGQGYWSNSCIQLGAQSFLFFNTLGYHVN